MVFCLFQHGFNIFPEGGSAYPLSIGNRTFYGNILDKLVQDPPPAPSPCSLGRQLAGPPTRCAGADRRGKKGGQGHSDPKGKGRSRI